MDSIKIVIYATHTGKEPFSNWENQLDKPIRAMIMRRLDRIKLGNFGDIKQIRNGNGIWELRIDCGPGYRIYLGRDGMKIIVLLAGGSKKTQTRDIAKAKQYWAEYKDSL
jgi:putative addiction module killer protein